MLELGTAFHNALETSKSKRKVLTGGVVVVTHKSVNQELLKAVAVAEKGLDWETVWTVGDKQQVKELSSHLHPTFRLQEL